MFEAVLVCEHRVFFGLDVVDDPTTWVVGHCPAPCFADEWGESGVAACLGGSLVAGCSGVALAEGQGRSGTVDAQQRPTFALCDLSQQFDAAVKIRRGVTGRFLT